MSRYVAAIVYRKRVGSMARKSILAYCAERANDDGSGVWPSKARVALEVECSRQTVIDTFKNFVAEGILIEVGKRAIGNGYVIEYDLSMEAIKKLPDAIPEEDLTRPDLDTSSSGHVKSVDTTRPNLDMTRQASLHDTSNELTCHVKPLDTNRPLTVPEPSLNLESSLFQDRDIPVSQKTATPKERTTSDLGESFEKFWNAYPKDGRKSKKAARAKFDRSAKDVTAEVLIAAAERYARWLVTGRPGEFRPPPKHALTWLNQGCWDDELPGVTGGGASGKADALEREAELEFSTGNHAQAAVLRFKAQIARGLPGDVIMLKRELRALELTNTRHGMDTLKKAIAWAEQRATG